MLPVVVIAGRPNVGKSTLFNRLAGRRMALVADTPGVTRDRREAEAMLRGRRVRLVDTAGLDEAPPEALAGRMHAGTATATAAADVVLFVVDARAGVTPTDRHFAQWLRRQGREVLGELPRPGVTGVRLKDTRDGSVRVVSTAGVRWR